jgi:D-alanine-D-alanine ligase-like ATP-grasp enzyme
MAMFSQKDEKTKIDFRHYDSTNPTRYVPFKLPEELEKKLDKLMRQVNLNTGSIDMILTEKNEYIFLEVNPIGQYGMTSVPCNYYLNKIIANYLIKEDDKVYKKTK